MSIGISRRHILVLGGLGAATGGLAACRGSKHSKPEGQAGAGDATARRYTDQDRDENGRPTRRLETETLGRDPLVLGPQNTQDPAEHSRIENLFWADRLREHAYFFSLLMPGDDLASHREEAERFMGDWHRRYDRARSTKFDQASYAAFNRDSIDLARRMSEWKKKMAEAQASGKLQTLVWPSFFRAASMEADYFIRRLDAYNAGSVKIDRKDVVDFWAHDTAGHLGMIAHLLDPEETELVERAADMSKYWKKIKAQKPAAVNGEDPVLTAEQEVIDFKTAVARGIDAGRIRSILRPLMMEHMRREGFRFLDELKRSGG